MGRWKMGWEMEEVKHEANRKKDRGRWDGLKKPKRLKISDILPLILLPNMPGQFSQRSSGRGRLQ